MQLKIYAALVCFSSALISGCASSGIHDPVSLGNGVFLVSSSGASVTDVKRELLSKAIEFCSDEDLMMHVESTHVTTREKFRDSSDESGEVGTQPGSVELTFSCRMER